MNNLTIKRAIVALITILILSPIWGVVMYLMYRQRVGGWAYFASCVPLLIFSLPVGDYLSRKISYWLYKEDVTSYTKIEEE